MQKKRLQKINRSNIRRILLVEELIMCPLKIIVVLFSYYFLSTLDVNKETYYYFSQLKLYVIANLFFIIALFGFGRRRFRPVIVRISAFFLSMIDNLYLCFLIFFTGGLDSELYLLYPGLLVRNAINFPEIKYQQTINITFILFYIVTIYSGEHNLSAFASEVFLLRLIMLILVSVCCWGIYFLLEKKNRQVRETQEMTIRSEKLHIASKLARQIAHELKNPLGIINNSAYLIRKKTDDSCEKILRQVDIIQQEVKKSDRIITELLDYSHLAESKITRVNVNQYIMNVLKDRTEQWIKIHFDLDHSLPDLFIDEAQLNRMFFHLFSNAMESFEEIVADNPEINILTRFIEDDLLEISVRDNGVGMPKHIQDKIFTPFFSTKSDHVGLGLSIAQNVVETYNGNITFRSLPGKGTTVTVRLPLHISIEDQQKHECYV
ncbi:MAG: ATP-binding protein [Candidatus Auribacterota bacterium]